MLWPVNRSCVKQATQNRGQRTLKGLRGSLCCGQDVSDYKKAEAVKVTEARCVDHLISKSIT